MDTNAYRFAFLEPFEWKVTQFESLPPVSATQPNISDHVSSSSSPLSSMSSSLSQVPIVGRGQHGIFPPLTISTQNVGGMRGEFHSRYGPKTSMLRKLINQNTDFFIMTEVRAPPQLVNKVKMRKHLQPLQSSLHEEARAGVIVYSHRDHKIIPESQRVSMLPGHFTMAVYEIAGSRTIVGGIYGPSANNDKESAKFFREVHRNVKELKEIYRTSNIILAGDFNAVWRREDANNHTTQKKQTMRTLQHLLEAHHLTDLGLQEKEPRRTWYRRGSQYQSSRIDYLLTSIPTTGLEFLKERVRNYLTIFDHTFLTARFGQKIERKMPAMKDYILGSEEFLIRAEECVLHKLTLAVPTLPPPSPPPGSPVQSDLPPSTLDNGFNLSKPFGNKTAMHVFNDIIWDLQKLHNDVYRDKNNKDGLLLQTTSQQLFDLKKRLRMATCSLEKDNVAERITQIQREISDRIEAKDEAARVRISNFYLTGMGTMQPQSFYCIKESNTSRKINHLEVQGQNISDPDEIVRIMQEHYEHTASAEFVQTTTLAEFLQKVEITLPQLSDEQRSALEEEFTPEEVKNALQDAEEASASGPSGQSLPFFKLLFLQIPNLFVQAINQLVFLPGLLSCPEFEWIRKRKVIYIPKRSNPLTPADYRPLSMLEVLYKIPSRIFSKRLGILLPQIIGPHQHGFMRQKGIQEPSIIMTHLIQDANHQRTPLQLVSFDIEKAFDRVTHEVIIQALNRFGFPHIYIQAVQDYILSGYAAVEVNNRTGTLVQIRRGSGQGDPMSSSLFLLASEPINLAIIKLTEELQYRDRYGNRYPPVLFADDNLSPLSIPTSGSLLPILHLYRDYHCVSGLNVNPGKSSVLCVNTDHETVVGLQQLGLLTPPVIKHLGIYLGPTMEATIQETIMQTDAKLVKRRILATTPPTDLLHRALLVNTAFIPVYNHILMALPFTQTQLEVLDKEVRSFFWTKQQDGHTVQKRRLVAKKRIPADYSVGGLKVPLLETTAKSFRLNLLQKIYKKTLHPTHFPPTILPHIIKQLLQVTGRPSLEDHVNKLGPTQWKQTALMIRNRNYLFSQMFQAGADLLAIYEKDKETWHQAPLYGHTLEGIFALTPQDFQLLQEQTVNTVSQLLMEDDAGFITREVNNDLLSQLHPNVMVKLRQLVHRILKKRPSIQGKQTINFSPLARLLLKDNNISTTYRTLISKQLTEEIGTAPAYSTRERDNVYVPDRDTFSRGYGVLSLPSIPSKTKEVAFQVLNRTVWTNKKAFQSGIMQDPACQYCGEDETMEHLLYNCENHTIPLWEQTSVILTNLCTLQHGQQVARIQLTPKEIVYNKPHPSLLLFILDDLSRKTILLFIQELKRAILHRRMNFRESQRNARIPAIRLQAHILTVIKKLQALLEYKGPFTNKSALQTMAQLKHLAQENIQD